MATALFEQMLGEEKKTDQLLPRFGGSGRNEKAA
jgi:hypothetical protein